MDKLQSIRMFLKLAETLSFKGTAAHFGVPPSTVSRSMKALETELGVSLVERTTRSVRLTEAGDWYRSEVSGPLRALAAADEMAIAQSQEPSGTVRITALAGYAELHLFPALNRFRAAHPNIIVDIELSDRYLDMSTGEIDIALRATADPPEYLVARRLHSHRYVLVGAPSYFERRGYPKQLADLEHHSAFGYRGPNGVLPWYATNKTGEVVTVPRDLVMVSNHGLLILERTLAGEGLSFLPYWGAAEALMDGSLEEVVLEDARLAKCNGPEMGLYMLYDSKKARLGKVRVLVDFLTTELSQVETDETPTFTKSRVEGASYFGAFQSTSKA